ncbi:hypothetical protein ABB26_16510 [Stenotrophomonas humi]|uniref:Transmembrane protein n=1 Tax=Stenotrophomonas humi TaxID=405444 RepID=A0A0R0BYN1_9GAMM|nr:hypothetical protein [Stenotrophomonas humi]KRG62432.1 hypothetical protein ABB26_16510 [Stenotrophomonas humi]
MSLLLVIIATVVGTAAAMLLYVASPQQQLRAAGPWPTRHAWWPGSVLAVVSLLTMWQLLAPLEAISAWLVLLTLVWSIAPFLGAWRARVRARRAT